MKFYYRVFVVVSLTIIFSYIIDTRQKLLESKEVILPEPSVVMCNCNDANYQYIRRYTSDLVDENKEIIKTLSSMNTKLMILVSQLNEVEETPEAEEPSSEDTPNYPW